MLSVILPVRNWPGDRVAACTRSFLRLKSAALSELLIVDFGSEPRVESPEADSRLRLIRAEAEVWSLAEAINVGVLHAQAPILAKTDADIIAGLASGPKLDWAVKAVVDGRIGLWLTQAVDLPSAIDVQKALAASPDRLDSLGRLRPRWGQGGLAIFSRMTWDAIGGFDSRFTGWGNEDNDFAERVRRAGHKVRWVDRDAVKIYHVWHPPSFHSTGVLARRSANLDLASKDRSVFRPVRLLHSLPPAEYRAALHSPHVARRASPLVTIAIASAERKNRTRMLKEAIKGYVGQIGDDMEFVVADNGASASEHTRLSAALDSIRVPARVRLIRMDEASIPGARNTITDAAAGRYICVADDDDIALPNRLADHLACFERNVGVLGSHGGWIDFDESTGVIEINEGKERTLETLLFGTGKITAHPASFYRTDVLRQIRYDESLALGSDLDLALRMANAGVRVAHTRSHVILRRFHAANVTVTGLSHQVTNGERSRRRLQDSLGSAMCEELAARAKASDERVYCRNRMDLQHIIEKLPGYAGAWRLHFPISELARMRESGDLSDGFNGYEDSQRMAIASSENGGSTDAQHRMPMELPGAPMIERVLEIVDGDVISIGSGINIGLSYVSRVIRGASKALKAKQQLAWLSIEAELMADQDFTDKCRRGFAWERLDVPKGTRRLLSAPMADSHSVIEALASLPRDSVLRGMVSVISDWRPEGSRYHLVTGPLSGREAVASAGRALRQYLELAFLSVAGGGIPCDF